MLLSELLGDTRLGLQVSTRATVGLDLPIGRMITTDLLEPGRYLRAGDVVLTGLMWRRRSTDSERFVTSVAAAGVSTVLAGRAQLGEIPTDLIEACRSHGLTLVEVPTEVAFTAITDHVTARDSRAEHATASLALARQRQLLAAIASGDSLDKLVEKVGSDIGHTCRILTPTGSHIVTGPGELPGPMLDVLTREFLLAHRLPSTVRVDTDLTSTGESEQSAHSIFAVGPGLGNRWQSWFLVVEGDHREWPRDDVDAVNELCAFAALDRSRREEGIRARRPIIDDALELVESGAAQSATGPRLRQAGIDPNLPIVAVVATLGDPDSGSAAEDAMPLLLDLALSLGPPVLVTIRQTRAVALLGARPGLPELVRTSLGRLAPGIGANSLAVGISGDSGVAALAGALDEARFALQVAQTSGRSVSVVASADVTSHVLLLANVPDDVRRTFAHRVLGPVIEQDQRTGGDLVLTLTEFLALSGSWTRTARALHLHVNTVRYRMMRVEDLTGRDLSRFEDRVDIFLALKSL